MTKQEGVIFGLIGVGAVVVLYILWQESQAGPETAANGEAIPETPSQQQYPTVPPINLGDVELNENANPAQISNTPLGDYQLPTVQVGTSQSECGCEDQSCEPAGVPVNQQIIPKEVLKAATDNLASYTNKVRAYQSAGPQPSPSAAGSGGFLAG